MPIYEFVCMSCESHFEELMRLDDGDPDCPDCGSGKTRRQLSVFATHGTVEQPSFGGSSGGGCCGGGCGSASGAPQPPSRARGVRERDRRLHELPPCAGQNASGLWR